MNCTLHPEVPAAAYCRTCGKALCEACKRDVRGVIYCEDCLATRLHGTLPEAVPGAPAVPVVVQSGPSPGLAGVLSGFFPFGIGQVYCGQYAKGLAYMIIFALIIWGISSATDVQAIFIVGLIFFWLFQMVDAVRTARAIQARQPAPDPLGVNRVFGGHRLEASRIPGGAIVLIIVGVLLLLVTLGGFHWMHNLWPVLLVVLGVWLIEQRWATLKCRCPHCRAQGVTWPAFLIAFGVLWLISNFTYVEMRQTWPILLIVIGGGVIAERSAPLTGHVEPPPASPTTPSGSVQVSQEVNR